MTQLKIKSAVIRRSHETLDRVVLEVEGLPTPFQSFDPGGNLKVSFDIPRGKADQYLREHFGFNHVEVAGA
jgi:hypothetical protein